MSRVHRWIAIAAVASVAAAAPAAEPDLEPLSFLAGAWGTEGEVVEYWLPPLRGLMVGINRDPQGESTPFFEFLRIEARADAIVYVASPRGAEPTDFPLVELSGSRAVFANLEHDFPQKLIYTRTGDDLRVEVGAERDGEWTGFTLSWSLVPCASAPSSQGDQAR